MKKNVVIQPVLELERADSTEDHVTGCTLVDKTLLRTESCEQSSARMMNNFKELTVNG